MTEQLKELLNVLFWVLAVGCSLHQCFLLVYLEREMRHRKEARRVWDLELTCRYGESGKSLYTPPGSPGYLERKADMAAGRRVP